MVLLLLETIIVIMNNIRWWCGWSLRCFLVVVRGLHRPFILIHHHKDNNINRSLPSLSFSLSLVVVVVGEKEREREHCKKRWWVFILRMMIFSPNALPSPPRIRTTQHSTTTRNNTITKKKQQQTKKRRRRRGSNSRTRWVFSNSHVSLLFTMLVCWISQCWDWNRSVDSWFLVDRIAAERLNHSATSALVYITR